MPKWVSCRKSWR